MKASDIPNLISFLRILLVAPTTYFLLNQEYKVAFSLFLIAGLSDGIDGLLARQFGWQTRLGAILDPIGDKLLLVSCYLALGWLGHLPVMLVVLVLLRDIVIISGAISYHVFIEEVTIQPLLISKLNTLLQIMLVVLIIFGLSGLAYSTWVTPAMTEILIWLVYVTTFASGIVYMRSWGRRAVSITRDRGNS